MTLLKPLKFFVFLMFLLAHLHADYTHPKSIENSTWNALSPYFLPENHPIKSKLDGIFSKGRPTESIENMHNAHFTWIRQRTLNNVIVAMHSKLHGYILKVYLDDQVGFDDAALFLKRIKGAQYTQEAIIAFGYDDYFKVPKKWLYPIPDDPSDAPGLQRKHFVLVCEDMNLVDGYTNEKLWRSNKRITKPKLKALFHLLNHVGLFDSPYITNIPFAQDKKIAFVDTEHHSKWPIKYFRLNRHLSPEMNEYWNSLVEGL